MQELTEQEIRKVFSLYYGQMALTPKEGAEWAPISVDVSWLNSGTTHGPQDHYKFWQLALKPLSSITDEEAIQVAIMHGYEYDTEDVTVMEDLRENGYTIIQGDPHEPVIWMAYQLLINKGYAVPLWFGIDHWANGKTAIELGIAIDVAEMSNNVT